jgi:CheY-like chemotaxis protein
MTPAVRRYLSERSAHGPESPMEIPRPHGRAGSFGTANDPRGAPRAAPQARAKRALVVDDDVSMRSALGQVLERLLGYVVNVVGDGEEAVAVMDEPGAVFDVVISDVTMPGMGGEVLAQVIGRRWPTTPVILISGDPVQPGSACSVREAGAGDSGPQPRARLAKPFSSRQLAEVLQQVLRSAS